MGALRVGSMFCGMGGIDLGFIQAGFEVVWANELDAAACKTYRHNFTGDHLQEQSIDTVTAQSLPDFDVLVAGFPCQSFSIAGRQRGFLDPRGNLFFQIARIAEAKLPPVIFLENVAHLQEHDGGRTFLTIYTTLVELGYSLHYRILSPHEYGNTPQIRQRIFIVAFQDANLCDRFSFPEPIPLTKTLAEVINRREKKHEIYYYQGAKGTRLAGYLRDKSLLYRLNPRGISKIRHGLCPTLIATMGTHPERIPTLRDDFGVRKLTLREGLDCQGFPKHFYFPNSIRLEDAYKQIGNSVAVPVIFRIAQNIRRVLEREIL